MATFEDYEVLSILGGNLSSSCYKVKARRSSNVYLLKVINHSKKTKEELIEKVLKRMKLEGNDILKLNNYIEHPQTESLYLIMESCAYGSLYNIIEKCNCKGFYITEEFLLYLLHKLINACKYVKQLNTADFDISKIFVNNCFNIKFLCFDPNNEEKKLNIASSIGMIMLQLCTLNVKPKFHNEIPSYYSISLKDIILHLLQMNRNKNSLDTIFWHPLVMSVSKEEKFNSDIFTSKSMQNKFQIDEIDISLEHKLENLKNHEIALKMQELKLKEWETALAKREKKVAILEKTVESRIMQADLHLKRTKNQKSKERKKINSENLDNSVDYCDSVIITATSTKLNNEHIKRNKFARSLSERRVKFKGHSPLKAIQNISINPKLIDGKCAINNGKFGLPIGSDKTEGSEKLRPPPKITKRFSLVNIFTKKNTGSPEKSLKDKLDQDEDCFKPIIWTEENKRQAFNLLRMMQNENTSVNTIGNVQHTKM